MGFLDTLFKNVANVFGGGAQALTGAASSAGQFLGQKGTQAFGKSAQSAGKSLGSFGQKALSQFAPKAIQGAMGGGQKSTGSMQNPFANTTGFSIPSLVGAMGPKSAPTGSGMTPGDIGATPSGSAQSKGFNLMDLFKGGGGKVTGGLGVMGLGHLMGGSPKLPSFQTDAMQNYQNYNTGKLPPNVEDMINRTAQINEDKATKQLRDVYKNARPGTDYTTDSAYQRDLANLQRTQTLNRADAQAQALLGFNQQELSRASELAQLSIAEIMAKTGMEAQEAQSIKEMFGNVGGAMISSGLGLDQYGFGE